MWILKIRKRMILLIFIFAHTENSTFVVKDDLYMHSHIFAQTFAAFVISDKCTIKINNDFQAAYARF